MAPVINSDNAETLDSLVNLISNIGTSRDKQSHSAFEQAVIGRAELEEAYRSWLPNKVTRIIPDDMVREGRTVKMDEDPEPFNNLADEIGALTRISDAYAWGRLYGGGAAYMVIRNDDPSKELDLNKISPENPIVAIHDFDMHDVSTEVNEDVRSPNYLRPETYRFSGEVPVHWSRVLGPFDGYRLPPRMQKANQGWGGSEVERVSSALLQSMSVNASVASLVHRADSLTIGIKGLLSKTQSVTKTAELVRRFEVAAALISNNSFFLYDKDNEVPGQLKAELSAPGGLISEMMSLAASATGVPVSRFFGTAPKGLNATGEGDREDYQSVIKGAQKRVFDPPLRRLDPIMSMSAYGRVVNITHAWNPLEQMSDLERAQARDAQADADSKYVLMGSISPSMVSRELLSRGEYAGLDEGFVEALESDEGKGDDTDGELGRGQDPESGEQSKADSGDIGEL